MTSVLLVIAVVGAVVLARRSRQYDTATAGEPGAEAGAGGAAAADDAQVEPESLEAVGGGGGGQSPPSAA